VVWVLGYPLEEVGVVVVHSMVQEKKENLLKNN
jgi:hypothetical protein